jgi:uncharacterized protein
MRIDGRRYRDEWLLNCYPSKKVSDTFVRISRTGQTVLLTADEEDQLNEFFMDQALFERLENTGHIITPNNSRRVFDDLATWLKGTYDGPGLHIVVATRRCNLNCTYCHMYPQPLDTPPIDADLQAATIPHIARFIMSSPRSELAVEFQGGEPFLNFPAIVNMVDEINRLNASGQKKITFNIVSNLMVVTDDYLHYCRKNKIRLSYSLNGPQHLHDILRITRNGSGSHAAVMRKITDINDRFPGLLASYPLCVVTQDNMTQLIHMADYYFALGYRELGLIHLKNLGNARGKVDFSMREFIPYYLDLLEYLYSKNLDPSPTVWYSERVVRVALTKILSSSNPLFVDWRNPIGYLSNCVVYDTDGEILPVDEARSLRENFSVGNVRNTSYDDLIRKRSNFHTLNLSIRDRDSVCRECTYNPYCGVSPVLHFAKTGRFEPEPHVSDECILVLAVFDWIFKKLTAEDPVPLLKMVPDYMSGVLQHLAKGTRPNRQYNTADGTIADLSSAHPINA